MSDWEKNTRTPIRTSSRPSFAVRADPSAPRPLEITVLHTNAQNTVKSLQKVARLAQDLAADIRLLVLQVVPYPLPLEMPDVPLEFTSQNLLETISPLDVDVRVDIRLGRDKEAMLESAFPAASLVIVGRRCRWWPSPENRIARLLRRRGHQVIPTDSE